MASSRFSSLSLLIFMALTSSYSSLDPKVARRRHREEAVQEAHDALVSAIEWVSASMYLERDGLHDAQKGMALSDCARLYEDGEETLRRLMGDYELVDAHTWLSAAMTAHSTCMEGLRQVNVPAPASARNVRALLRKALALHAPPPADLKDDEQFNHWWNVTALDDAGLLVSWDASKQRADMVVAQDGSGNYKTINEAVAALQQQRRESRVVIYIKRGVYKEYVDIGRKLKNVMFVGDGTDNTIITGDRNVLDGYTTFSSATFGKFKRKFIKRFSRERRERFKKEFG